MVSRHRRTVGGAVAAVVGAGLVVTLVLLTTAPGSPTPLLPASGIFAHASVTPRSALFGDTIVAHVTVLYDPRRVKKPTVAVSRDLSSYVVAGAPTIERRGVGRARFLAYTFRMACLDHPCLPVDPTQNGTNLFSLPSVEVDYRRAGGASGVEPVPLPRIDVTSRLTPEDVTRLNAPPHPPVRASTSPLPVPYGVSPALLEALFLAGAAVLLALAGVLFYRFGPRLRRSGLMLSPLERALVLVERSRTRGLVPEQRKALELLARELGRTGEDDLALSARVLAWSEPAPERNATVALAGVVRETVLGRTNGRPR